MALQNHFTVKKYAAKKKVTKFEVVTMDIVFICPHKLEEVCKYICDLIEHRSWSRVFEMIGSSNERLHIYSKIIWLRPDLKNANLASNGELQETGIDCCRFGKMVATEI